MQVRRDEDVVMTKAVPDSAGSRDEKHAPVAPWRIGVDVGGTFTDLVLVDAASRLFVFKSPSVPASPADGVLNVVATAARGLAISTEELIGHCALLVHGSTVATNAVLEGKGAKVGLIATHGHRDCLDIRRGIRENQWDHRDPYPAVLVPRHLRLPVRGRLDRDGKELKALSIEDIDQAIATFAAEGVEAIAITLINSCIDPRHETAVAEHLRANWPGGWVSSSREVSPIIGEYERTSTTVVNAYLAPGVSSYLLSLQARLRALGLQRPVLMLQSNGGAASIEQVAPYPVRLVLSGPAAGVGAMNFFRHCNSRGNIISMEIGGTSCDVVVMSGGQVPLKEGLLVGGYHVAIPSVEIHTVAAGGGTIARLDSAGLLVVGPQGAGANPGPACYARGGSAPTVTDAQVVLGRLRPGPIADGSVSLDRELAHAAVKRVADPLGISEEAAATGIIRLLEQHLLHAVAAPSIQRGLDPRDFTLIAAGGAGPMHGVAVAQRLGCPTVFVPRHAGGFCALGLLASDVRLDYVQVCVLPLAEATADMLDDMFASLLTRASGELRSEGFDGDQAMVERALDLRYRGQQSTIRLALAAGATPDTMRALFEQEHQRLYGHIQPESDIDIVNLRTAGRGRLPELMNEAAVAVKEDPDPIGTRRVFLNEQLGWQDIAVFSGATLRPGHTLTGPAIIEEATTTLFVADALPVEVDHSNNYVIHLSSEEAGHEH